VTDAARPGTPRLALETDWLAMVAADLLAQRAGAYPALVDQGKLSAADAALGLRVAGAIKADWWHRLTLQPRAADPDATKAEKIATLEGAVTRTTLRVGKAGEALPKLAQRYVGDPAEMHQLAQGGFFGTGAEPAVRAWLHAHQYAETVAALLWWERQPFDHLFIAATNIALGVRPRTLKPAEAA